MPADLARLVAAWHNLPEAVRETISGLVDLHRPVMVETSTAVTLAQIPTRNAREHMPASPSDAIRTVVAGDSLLP